MTRSEWHLAGHVWRGWQTNYHYEGLGSVAALSDSDGDTVQVCEYDAYGQVAASDLDHPSLAMLTGAGPNVIA
jgi:hypothetical protein